MMNLIARPVETLANYIGKLDQSSSRTNKFLAVGITATVFPIFLSMELVFFRAPQFLSLQFSLEQNNTNECSKKIQKLANSIILSYRTCQSPLEVTESFMSYQIQEQLVLSNYSNLQWASEEIKNDSDFITQLIRINPDALQYASEELKNDREFILETVMIYQDAFNYASEPLKNDREFILEIAGLNFNIFEQAPEFLKNDPDFILNGISIHPSALSHASESLRNDRQFILQAAQLKGTILLYAADIFKKDHEVVLKAVQQNGLALNFVDDDLKICQEIVLAAVRRNGLAFQYVPNHLKTERKIVLEAIRQCGCLLMSIPECFKNDREIVLTAVSDFGDVLKYASDELKNDREIVLAAVNSSGHALSFASDRLKDDREVVLTAIWENSKARNYASANLRNDPEIKKIAFYSKVSNSHCLIDGRRYFPKPLNAELKNLHFLSLPVEASIEHLKNDLNVLLNNLQESQLQLLRSELDLNNTYTFVDCKNILSNFFKLLFDRIQSKEAYTGTPPAGSNELTVFYDKIEFYLKHLDHFFSKEENQLPNAFVERLQLLQTQSGCGSRFQGEAEQLFSMHCLPLGSMSLAKRLAIMASNEAKKVIQSIMPHNNVHLFNILNWQLDDYLVGPKVERDFLATPLKESYLMKEFLMGHTAENLVSQIQTVLIPGSEFESIFSDYVKENLFYEINEEDQIAIQNQVIEYWNNKKALKLSNFHEYQDAIAGKGRYNKIVSKQKLLDILSLTLDEASCKNDISLLELLETYKTKTLDTITEQIRNNYISEKKYEKYFDRQVNKWKDSTIALVLEQVGILVSP